MQIANAKALKAYQGAGLNGLVEEASPEEIIRLLLEGFMTRVSRAEGQMRRGEVAARLASISKAIGIIDGLRDNLDVQAGGELAERWDALYDYVSRRLFEANVTVDPAILVECRSLVAQIRDAWVEVACPKFAVEGAAQGPDAA